MKKALWVLAPLLAVLFVIPLGAAVTLTAVITPAAAEQARLDGCGTTVAASGSWRPPFQQAYVRTSDVRDPVPPDPPRVEAARRRRPGLPARPRARRRRRGWHRHRGRATAAATATPSTSTTAAASPPATPTSPASTPPSAPAPPSPPGRSWASKGPPVPPPATTSTSRSSSTATRSTRCRSWPNAAHPWTGAPSHPPPPPPSRQEWKGGSGSTCPPAGTPRLASLTTPPATIPAAGQGPVRRRRREVPAAVDAARRDRHGRDRPRTHHRHLQRRRARVDAVHARHLRRVRRRRRRRRAGQHPQRRRQRVLGGELPHPVRRHQGPRRGPQSPVRVQPRHLVRQRRPALRPRLRRRPRPGRPDQLRWRSRATRTSPRCPPTRWQRCWRGPGSRPATRTCSAPTAPNAWDCSSFTQAAYRHIGLTLPRTAGAQRDWLAAGHGTRIPPGQERPGDLIFWDSYLGPNAIGHVVIVKDPTTRTTFEAKNPRAGVGTFSYAGIQQGKHIYEIWRPGATDRRPMTPPPDRAPTPQSGPSVIGLVKRDIGRAVRDAAAQTDSPVLRARRPPPRPGPAPGAPDPARAAPPRPPRPGRRPLRRPTHRPGRRRCRTRPRRPAPRTTLRTSRPRR